MAIKFLPLYGAAYRSQKALEQNRIHAVECDSTGSPLRILCRGPKLENVCEDPGQVFTQPTCPTCHKRVDAMKRKERK